MYRIAVLISGGGSNLQSLIDNIEEGNINCSIEYVISDRPGVLGLERAEKHGIKTLVVDRKIYGEEISDEICKAIHEKVDFVVLAGFLSLLSGSILREYKNKIINIHPSLIPSFCGRGMYGIKVHEKAIESGVKLSGCTVHFVDEGTDTGPIILQKYAPVYFEDDAVALQKRVLVQEHFALPEAVKLMSENRVQVVGDKVKIL